MVQTEFEINKLNLKLLVSIKNEILLIDLLKQQVITFFDGATSILGKLSVSYDPMCESYYGITWDADQNAIYAIGSNEKANHGTRLKTKLCQLNLDGSLERFVPIDKSLSFAAAHQIQFFDGHIWVADTMNNCVRKIHPLTGMGGTIKIDKNRFGAHYDHVNSLWFNDDKLYIMGNGTALQVSPCIHIFDYASLTKIDEIRQGVGGSHNICNLWGHLVTFNSYQGNLVDENNQILLELDYFTRGLSVTSDYILVGQSESASRDQRLNTNSGWISIYGHKDKKFVGRICLKEIGQIHEIRVLNQPDLAHSCKHFPQGV